MVAARQELEKIRLETAIDGQEQRHHFDRERDELDRLRTELLEAANEARKAATAAASEKQQASQEQEERKEKATNTEHKSQQESSASPPSPRSTNGRRKRCASLRSAVSVRRTRRSQSTQAPWCSIGDGGALAKCCGLSRMTHAELSSYGTPSWSSMASSPRLAASCRTRQTTTTPKISPERWQASWGDGALSGQSRHAAVHQPAFWTAM